MIDVPDTGLVPPARFVGIKRNTGLDGILDEHKAQDVDEVRKVEVNESAGAFSKLFERYVDALGYDIVINRPHEFYNSLADIDVVLTPQDINNFLQATVQFERLEKYEGNTGIFLSKLIQNSYDAGYNNFRLDFDFIDFNIDWVGSILKADEDRPLHLHAEGNVGHGCGSHTENVEMMFDGNVGIDCAKYSKFSKIYIAGNSDEGLGAYSKRLIVENKGNAKNIGYKAKYSQFHIKGNVKSHLGNAAEHSKFKVEGDSRSDCGLTAKDCGFVVYGKAGYPGYSAERCTFYLGDFRGQFGHGTMRSTFITSDKEVYNKMLNWAVKPGCMPRYCDNKIILFNADGNIERVVKKDFKQC